MRISLNFFVLLSTLAFNIYAKDGHDKGSGGDVVACFMPISQIFRNGTWYGQSKVVNDLLVRPEYEKIGNHTIILKAKLKYTDYTNLPPHNGKTVDRLKYKYYLVKEGELTEWGKQLVSTIDTLEYYKIKRNTPDHNFQWLFLKDHKAVRKQLINYFSVKGNEILITELNRARDPSIGIGLIHENGTKSEVALTDIKDNGIERRYTTNCLQLQAVLRENGILEYDLNIWDNLGIHHFDEEGKRTIYGQPFQQELLQLHEELYFVGEDHPELRHENALDTIKVIYKMGTVKEAGGNVISERQKKNILMSSNFWLGAK